MNDHVCHSEHKLFLKFGYIPLNRNLTTMRKNFLFLYLLLIIFFCSIDVCKGERKMYETKRRKWEKKGENSSKLLNDQIN
jgi:hypothetical protein